MFSAARRQESPLTNTRTSFIARCTDVGEIKGTISDSLYRLHCEGYYCMFHHVYQVNFKLYLTGISCSGYGVFLRRPFKSLRVFDNNCQKIN